MFEVLLSFPLTLSVDVQLCLRVLQNWAIYPQSFYYDNIQEIWNFNGPSLRRPLRQCVCDLYVYIIYPIFQAELKTLQEISSPSFEFAKDLMKHNLVSLA